jgi:hypothetical protein
MKAAWKVSTNTLLRMSNHGLKLWLGYSKLPYFTLHQHLTQEGSHNSAETSLNLHLTFSSLHHSFLAPSVCAVQYYCSSIIIQQPLY